jgi:hypothetical protein
MKRIISLVFAAFAAVSSTFAAIPDVSVIKKAADALSKTDPGLSSSLSDIASRDSAAAKRTAQGAAVGGNSVQDNKDIKTLNQSADKLDPTNPDLSKQLRSYADQKSNLMKSHEFQNLQQHQGYTP